MKCGNCGATLDGHTCVTDKKAELSTGDVSICFYCGEVCQFVNGKLVVVDIKNLPEDVQIEVLKQDAARRRTLKV